MAHCGLIQIDVQTRTDCVHPVSGSVTGPLLHDIIPQWWPATLCSTLHTLPDHQITTHHYIPLPLSHHHFHFLTYIRHLISCCITHFFHLAVTITTLVRLQFPGLFAACLFIYAATRRKKDRSVVEQLATGTGDNNEQLAVACINEAVPPLIDVC